MALTCDHRFSPFHCAIVCAGADARRERNHDSDAPTRILINNRRNLSRSLSSAGVSSKLETISRMFRDTSASLLCYVRSDTITKIVTRTRDIRVVALSEINSNLRSAYRCNFI